MNSEQLTQQLFSCFRVLNTKSVKYCVVSLPESNVRVTCGPWPAGSGYVGHHAAASRSGYNPILVSKSNNVLHINEHD